MENGAGVKGKCGAHSNCATWDALCRRIAKGGDEMVQTVQDGVVARLTNLLCCSRQFYQGPKSKKMKMASASRKKQKQGHKKGEQTISILSVGCGNGTMDIAVLQKILKSHTTLKVIYIGIDPNKQEIKNAKAASQKWMANAPKHHAARIVYHFFATSWQSFFANAQTQNTSDHVQSTGQIPTEFTFVLAIHSLYFIVDTSSLQQLRKSIVRELSAFCSLLKTRPQPRYQTQQRRKVGAAIVVLAAGRIGLPHFLHQVCIPRLRQSGVNLSPSKFPAGSQTLLTSESMTETLREWKNIPFDWERTCLQNRVVDLAKTEQPTHSLHYLIERALGVPIINVPTVCFSCRFCVGIIRNIRLMQIFVVCEGCDERH